MTTSSNTVTLVSKDEQKFVVEREISKTFGTIKDYLGSMDNDESVEIPVSVDSDILEKVIEYATYYYNNPATDDTVSKASPISGWDLTFLENVSLENTFRLILAANYLNAKQLLDLSCKLVASKIKGKTPEELRLMFGVNREFTPEETQKVYDENPWLVQTPQ